MSWLDFARDVGAKIFDRDGEAARNIKEHLDISLTGIKDLEVSYDDGVVTLCGECDRVQTRDMAILLAGNVKGVGKVIADDLKAPEPPPEQVEKAEYYVIAKGDTLSAIAKRYYGNAMQYKRIFEANRELIKDPDKIYPGQKIRIPLD